MEPWRPTRRSVVAGAAATLSVPAVAARPSGRWTDGVQLWSVSAELDADFDGTLTALARIGFRDLETAGLHGRSPERFRSAVDGAGLRVRSMHVPLSDFAGDGEASFEAARILGATWIVCPAPLPASPPAAGQPWLRAMRSAMTSEAWVMTARALNRAGSSAAARGLRLAYHNHPFEFARVGGVRGFDLLMQRTDPTLVAFELDVAWAMAGGADPVALLGERPSRFRLLHLKGLPSAPRPGSYGVDFATGVVGRDDVVPWTRVLRAAEAAGVEGAFVEQGPPHVLPVIYALRACRSNLSRL